MLSIYSHFSHVDNIVCHVFWPANTCLHMRLNGQNDEKGLKAHIVTVKYYFIRCWHVNACTSINLMVKICSDCPLRYANRSPLADHPFYKGQKSMGISFSVYIDWLVGGGLKTDRRSPKFSIPETSLWKCAKQITLIWRNFHI